MEYLPATASALACRRAWLQSRRMREPTSPASTPVEPSQQSVITRAFAVAEVAAEHLVSVSPALDRDRAEYAVASAVLEEAWGGGA